MSRHYGYAMSDGKTPGELIREWREANHLTQEQLARKIGVSNRTPNRWETHKHIPQSKEWNALRRLGIELPEERGQLRMPDDVARQLADLQARVAELEATVAGLDEVRLAREGRAAGIRFLEAEESDLGRQVRGRRGGGDGPDSVR
jgi:transcriptional regulator with XRE-family HTH domain